MDHLDPLSTYQMGQDDPLVYKMLSAIKNCLQYMRDIQGYRFTLDVYNMVTVKFVNCLTFIAECAIVVSD